jgi:hypothetical protein
MAPGKKDSNDGVKAVMMMLLSVVAAADRPGYRRERKQ